MPQHARKTFWCTEVKDKIQRHEQSQSKKKYEKGKAEIEALVEKPVDQEHSKSIVEQVTASFVDDEG